MSEGQHHHVASRNLLHREALEERFAAADIVGASYLTLLHELTKIVEHQWRSSSPHGLIKGFLLTGPPGTGKTTLAKRLAYELMQRFEDPVVLAFVDGAEIARSRYGESEERIVDLFMHAKAGFTQANQRSVLLFDDIDSIFMARGSEHSKEWHFSQNSVFFHAVDTLHTNRSIIVLTTNRPDLVDDAIRDRFLSYDVDYPGPALLEQIALNIEALRRLEKGQAERLATRLHDAVHSGDVRSIRDAERFVVKEYIRDVLGTSSLAVGTEG